MTHEISQFQSEPLDADATVQMSVRMNKEVYRRFRALCKKERRTNGDMLHQMLEQYLSGDAGESKDQEIV